MQTAATAKAALLQWRFLIKQDDPIDEDTFDVTLLASLEAAITGPEEPDASWAAKIPSAEDVERVRAELEAMGITNLETLKAADAHAKTILGDNWDEYAMSGTDFWSEVESMFAGANVLSGSHITPFTLLRPSRVPPFTHSLTCVPAVSPP